MKMPTYAEGDRRNPSMFIVSSRGENPDHKLHEIFNYTLAPVLFGTMCGKWVEGRRYRNFPPNISYCEDCLNVKF